tara:strand:+ start:214 stop:495 length:282 start_codon:yes stop_codon:yes gene_type:complete
MENKENTLENQKKTDFPDLERLPDYNSFKHFLSVLYNMPKSFFEDLYKTYFLKDKIELEKMNLQLIQKDMELKILKARLREMEFVYLNNHIKR